MSRAARPLPFTKKNKSWAQLISFQCRAYKIPIPQFEYRFDQRRWRFDAAWPDLRLACEIDGGIYSGGRHVRGKGVEDGYEKDAAALIQGWRVMHVSTDQLKNGQAIMWLALLMSRQIDARQPPSARAVTQLRSDKPQSV